MAYQPFLIAPFQSGLDSEAEPWLLPQDAFTDIENAHIKHGYIEKRKGYTKQADMVHGRPISAITNADPAVFTVADTSDLTNGDTVTLHYLDGGTWNTLNSAKYTITVQTGTTFTLADSGGTDVDGTSLGAYTANTGRLGTFPALPMMGIFRYITSAGARNTLVADTKRVAIYNAVSNIYEPLDLFDSGSILRTNDDVFDSTDADSLINYVWESNWQSAGLVNRVYFSNGQPFDGGTPGTGGILYYDANTYGSPATPAVVQFQPSLGGTNVLYGCKLLFSIKQRLLALYTYEFNGSSTNTFPQRARWCQAQGPSNWDDTTPGGGGFVDAPTGDHIITARQIQDTIIVAFTDSIWAIKPVSDPALPFRWEKINDFRAADGKMASAAFDRYVVALGQRGITATDGTETRRVDDRIQDFTTEEINQDQFQKVFGRRSFSNRRTWMLYPEIESAAANAALIYDDESGAYSKYTFSDTNDMNVLGYGQQDKDLAAQDFTEANNLDYTALDFADSDETALSFFYDKNAEIFLGGNRVGEIVVMEEGNSDEGTDITFQLKSAGWNPFMQQGVECQLGYVDFYCDSDQVTKFTIDFYKNDNESPYHSQKMDLLPNLNYITSVSNIALTDAGDPTQGLTITCDSHGLETGDQIYIYGAEGMQEVNDLQYSVTVVNDFTFRVAIDATGFGTYTTGGVVVKRRFYRTKVWKRAYAGGVGYLHQIRMRSTGSQAPFRIHAVKPWFRPRGKRTLG